MLGSGDLRERAIKNEKTKPHLVVRKAQTLALEPLRDSLPPSTVL